jgi:hypothetical protein
MDVKDYRKSYEDQLAVAAAQRNETAAKPSLAGAEAGSSVIRSFRDALRTPMTHDEFNDNVRQLIATLQNSALTTQIRLAALRALNTLAFLGDKFAPFRAEYLAALRQIARPGVDPELCERALEVLAAEKDPDAQDLLRRGLRDPKSALVSAAKALQFLSYDDHSNVADLALSIFNQLPDLGAKEAALRVLGTDPKSQDLFANLLKDKNQPLSLRTLSATGLHLLNPQKFADIAQQIIGDHSDSEDIRASSLGALANTLTDHALRTNSNFQNLVRQLGADNSLQNLSAAARRMLPKF